MKPPATLGAYAAVLAVVFVAALGVGKAVGPIGTAKSTAQGSEHEADGGRQKAPEAGGLASSQDGYTLRLSQAVLPRAVGSTLSFVVTGPDGRPLTTYTRSHDKDLHLIVARRDLTGFQHVHPTRAADGTWSIPLTFAQAGPYKVFADFTPSGRDRALTLAADLTVPGAYTPEPLAAEGAVSNVDGYDLELDGRLVAGTSSKLTFTVTKDGRPVTDLQPYLGAYGHLVALREGDLAYLHVHPAADRPGPQITFYADVPTASTYRLFLDFRHAGVVRTAELTATAPTATSTPTPHGH